MLKSVETTIKTRGYNEKTRNVFIRRARLLTVCLAMLACCAVSGDEIEKAASAIFVEAYDMMHLGRVMESQDMTKEAVDFYKRAMSIMEDIRRDFPDWRIQPVGERMEVCAERIYALTGKVADIAVEASAPPLARPAIRDVAIDAGGIESDFLVAEEMERMADFESAIEIYDEYLETNPDNLKALKGLVRCYLATGRGDEAMRAASRFDDQAGFDLRAATLLCMVYSMSGRHREAVGLMRSFDSVLLSDAAACMAMGVALAGAGREGDAVKHMRRALELEPGRADANYNLAKLLIRQNPPDLERARAHYIAYLDSGGSPDGTLSFLLFPE